MPPIANPRPEYLCGSFLFSVNAIIPVTMDAGESSNPAEQHHPTVIAAAPRQSDTIASVWSGLACWGSGANICCCDGCHAAGCDCQPELPACSGQRVSLVTRAWFIITVGDSSANLVGGSL